MKNNRILLSENEAAANELIQYNEIKVANGKTLLSKLDKMGLTLTSVSDWKLEVEQPLSKQFPNASITFNVQSAGIDEEYISAKNFFEKNQSIISFEEFTEEQAEAIREEQRHYAESPQQLKAYGLMQTVVDSLLRLSELGVKLNLDELYQVSYLFTGGNRHAPLQVNKREQISVLMKLK